ncbi:hypothetical protein SGRA_2253 [Saprospira grandis str. Lewin]|uniref:Uncharacterized protein n=1 Tax=Saprospira grandis (strain Lewin) TaxID=984262 RepID=H6L3N4_SAPGL|nr:hypothetical protein SGRA_2253 [Saprospira grandis str. Lewin]
MMSFLPKDEVRNLTTQFMCQDFGSIMCFRSQKKIFLPILSVFCYKQSGRKILNFVLFLPFFVKIVTERAGKRLIF